MSELEVNESQTAEEQASGEEETKKRNVIYTFEKEFSQIRDGLALSASDETLIQYANQYGFTPERIAVGQSYFDETDTLYENQKRAIAARLAATRDYMTKRGKAEASYNHFVQTCRLAFKGNPDVLDALDLRGTRKRSYGGWSAQAKYFYNQVFSVPGVVEELVKYNVTQADLESGKQELLDTIAAETGQEDAKAEAQKATELKSKAWRKLKRWWSGYIQVMKVALQDDRQMQEKLGIVTPSQV